MLNRYVWPLMLLLAFILTACDTATESDVALDAVPPNAIEISIIYAPESHDYMPKFITDFNASYRNGTNPVTGQALAEGERPIYVRGEQGSSGVVMQSIVNAVIAPNNADTARPTIFQPSVSHWLALANYLSRREIFDLNQAQPTANAPVVMAIWESRLRAIQNTVGYDDIGWEELLMVLDAENGWQDFGIANGRRTVYYGHTDPFVSSTALSTLIAEYYAAARDAGFTGRVLTMEQVRDEAIQDGVRQIENLIRHYSRRTTEFKNYIAQGPDYLDFVALEENDLIAINRGLTEFQPPERLVALYPKEGTFWHEHPFGIVNANWTTPEQRQAARVFTDYVLMPEQQEYLMQYGFRPVNPDVPLGFPFDEQNGVTIEGPTNVLDVPEADVIAAIQESWEFVKKQADIILLIDTSGSMQEEDKIGQAKSAALTFLDNMPPTNRVGLVEFFDDARVLVPLDNVETNASTVRQSITALYAEGGTSLYDGLMSVMDLFEQNPTENRIQAIVLLSDGADTQSTRYRLDDVLQRIEASHDTRNPVIVVPIAYGSNAAVRELNSIANASNTTLQSGNPQDILTLLELISSYF